MTIRTPAEKPTLIINCPICRKAVSWRKTRITETNQVICEDCFTKKTKGAKKAHAKRT